MPRAVTSLNSSRRVDSAAGGALYTRRAAASASLVQSRLASPRVASTGNGGALYIRVVQRLRCLVRCPALLGVATHRISSRQLSARRVEQARRFFRRAFVQVQV